MHSFPELVLLLYRAAQTNHKMFFSFKTGFHLHYIVIIFKTLGQCISYCCSVFLWLSEKRPCMQSTLRQFWKDEEMLIGVCKSLDSTLHKLAHFSQLTL